MASLQDDPATTYALQDEREWFLKRLSAAMTHLTVEDATIVRLHFEEEMTFLSIALALELPLEHVLYRKSVAMKKLMDCMVTHTHKHRLQCCDYLRFIFDFSTPIGLLETTTL